MKILEKFMQYIQKHIVFAIFYALYPKAYSLPKYTHLINNSNNSLEVLDASDDYIPVAN